MLLIVEIKGYQYSGAFILDSQYCHQEENKSRIYAFCIYSESVIKIFNLKGVWERYCNEEFISNLKHEEQEIIKGINKEINLKWWQKVIRFISFGYLYSNKSHLCATIYDKDKLSFWQKAINFMSFGYFYPTTAMIFGVRYGVRYEYSDNFNGKPVLWKFLQINQSGHGVWSQCEDSPKILPAIESEGSTKLDDQKYKEELEKNEDVTYGKHFLTCGNFGGPKSNQNVSIPLCIQQNMLSSNKLDEDKKYV